MFNHKQWYLDNKEKIDKKHAEYDAKHKEEKRQYRKDNAKHTKEYNQQYYITHREEIREQHKQYCNAKRKEDIRFNLNDKITTLMYYSLRSIKAGRHWEDLINYTLEELKNHLEKTMPTGYTWEDFLNGELHIDHKIPVSVFNYTKPEHVDFKRCWALTNLQLLPAKENLMKSNKLQKPFQPALAMG